MLELNSIHLYARAHTNYWASLDCLMSMNTQMNTQCHKLYGRHFPITAICANLRFLLATLTYTDKHIRGSWVGLSEDHWTCTQHCIMMGIDGETVTICLLSWLHFRRAWCYWLPTVPDSTVGSITAKNLRGSIFLLSLSAFPTITCFDMHALSPCIYCIHS